MCKNEYRRLQVRQIVETNPDMDEVLPDCESEYHPSEKKVDQKTFEKALSTELDQLDDGHRTAFLLRHQQNLSIREIGEVLGCSEGTVKSRLFYTTQKLAAKLKAFNPYKAEVRTNGKIK
jgi:RNA polymerase sigma-70 factor (ECF subfamily)